MSLELAVQACELVLRERGKVQAREPFAAADGSLPEALQRLLAQRAASRLTVRVASAHVRLLVLPWVAQLTSAERWRALAASRFEQTYGEAPEAWLLRVADDLPPRPRLAVALPAASTSTLREVKSPVLPSLIEGSPDRVTLAPERAWTARRVS